jgi:uncharacterized RDD family membrane protein YckC
VSDLVTGEAVVLGVQPAKLPSRMIACFLDMAVLLAVVAALTLLLAFTAPDLDEAAAAAVTLTLTVGILIGIPVAVETLSRGRSLGKLALGLRVVRTDGGPIRFRHALVRGLVGCFEVIMMGGVPAAISSMLSDRGRRLGDLFAGTLVVRERVPGAGGGRSPLPPLPPRLMVALGGELSSLDLSRVPDALWLAVRQYLGRMGQLDPRVAWSLAHQLSGDLAACTGRAVPEGLHPAAYLGAVLTERQNREWARAVAQGQVPGSAVSWAQGPQTSVAPPQHPAPAPFPTTPAPAPFPTTPPSPASAPADLPSAGPAPTSGDGGQQGGFAPPA